VARDLAGNPLSLLLHSWPPGVNRFIFRDIVVNVALYVPAGVTGHLAFRRFGKMWLSVAAPIVICTVVSGSIEMIQLFVPSRDTSALDLATNVAGAAIGVFLAVMTEDVFLENRVLAAERKARKTAKPPDRATLALLGCWIVWLWFPLFPVMGRTILGHKLNVFFGSPVADPVPFFSALLAWLLAGNLFLAGGLRPVRRLMAISTAVIPAQLFIVDRQPVLAEMTGALAGAVGFVLLSPWRRSHRDAWWKLTAWAFLGMVVVRGLAPFRFSGAIVNSFSWIPFGGFLQMNWQSGVQVMAEKSFWYGGAIWLLRASGMRLVSATVLVTATLLSIEIAQMHLHGRIAEITDPLWGIFAGCAIAVVSNRAAALRESGQAKAPAPH
jgi:VanZ family protein